MPPSPATLHPDFGIRLLGLGWRILPLAVFHFLFAFGSAHAFPPAPHHTFYGMVRDQMGDPLVVTNAEVIFETLTGTQVKTMIVPQLSPGQNYQLNVPMDGGLTADNYKPTAMRPTVAFRMKVKIGAVTYLPIEMTGNFSNLGQPAKSTRVDLTLGEDLDGDGLPDAWERSLIAMLGLSGLHDINPNDDADADGLTNLQEYLAGTYAFDPADGFRLNITGFESGQPLLEFLAIRGRTYVLYSSEDMNTWQPMEFRLAEEGPAAPARKSYPAVDVRHVRLRAAVPPTNSAAIRLFKVQVQ